MFLLLSLLYSYCISSVSIMKMYSNILKFIFVTFFLLSVRKVFTSKSKIRTLKLRIRRYNLLCSARKYNIDNEIIKPLKTGITELVKEFGKGIDIDQESKAILNGKMPAEAKGFVGGFDYMDSSSAGAPQTVMFVAPITKV